MIAESYTKEAVLPGKDQLRVLNQNIGALFMDFEKTDLDPEARVKDARKKINEAREYLSALKEKYPTTRYPEGHYRKVHELLSTLEASCQKAEKRMGRFANIRLRKKEVSLS